MAGVSTKPGRTPDGKPGRRGSSATSAAQSRREKLASLEAARKREQRLRTVRLLVICGVLAMALLAYPVYLFVQDYRARSVALEDVGASISAAGCDPVVNDAATGNQEHVPEGTDVEYAQSPPDSGQHYDTPAPFTNRFYTMADRPAVETLVHNLEHGYTVAWYRDTAPADQVEALQSISKTFGGDDYDPADKFIAAPWSEADGAGFPAGKDLVLARWTANPTDTTQQQGVRQACTLVSGTAVKDFMARYPYTNSPEPNAA